MEKYVTEYYDHAKLTCMLVLTIRDEHSANADTRE